jgi:hypothetical protein
MNYLMSFQVAVIFRFVFAFVTAIPLDSTYWVLDFLMKLQALITFRYKLTFVTMKPVYSVALRNATMAIGRSRRPRGPTYARGANRSQFEDPELAVNARHLATRRAHPAFKFFYVAHSGSGKLQFRVICASHHGGGWKNTCYPRKCQAEVASRL